MLQSLLLADPVLLCLTWAQALHPNSLPTTRAQRLKKYFENQDVQALGMMTLCIARPELSRPLGPAEMPTSDFLLGLCFS